MLNSKNKKPSCLFISTISPLDKGVKSGGSNLTRANFSSLNELCSVELMNTLAHPSSFINKILRMGLVFFGDLAGNSFFFRYKLKKKLRVSSYDYVFIDHSQLGNLAKLIRKMAPQVKIIGSFQNIESQYIVESLKLPGFIQAIMKKAALFNEQILVRDAHILLCLTPEDSDQIHHLYGKTSSLVIPITTSTYDLKSINNPSITLQSIRTATPYLLFCGSYFHPNIEGVKWFVKNVLDQIQYPLLIIGYQMEILRSELFHPKLKIIGTVDDVAPYYQFATAVINPVFKGAGMNSKSVEAIGFGKPLYTTPFATRGFPKPLPQEIFICNNEKEFIETLAELPSHTNFIPTLKEYHKNHFTQAQRTHKLSQFII